ncbi:unnamed protein product [Rhizoctonia solani]|uniref:Lysine-specific metallo-endopeptidase domain-containing protein n=1 Tax=Rhizoctonia solani TaxID=456999 RepID=A0A8H3GW32_9AGAM|nr:unnamed protein product [Rhizoctonia solani]
MLVSAAFILFTALLASADHGLPHNFAIPSIKSTLTDTHAKVAATKDKLQGPSSFKNTAVPWGASPSSRHGKYPSCSADQQIQIAKAISVAQRYVHSSVTYLKKWKLSGSPLYTRWFGAFDKNRRGLTVLSFSRLRTSLDKWTYECTCTDSKLVVQAHTGQYGIIKVCPGFWSAPAAGDKSAAFAIIREGTRFEQVLGTFNVAHGRSESLAIAMNKPDSAVYSANNHAYFSVDAYLEEPSRVA